MCWVVVTRCQENKSCSKVLNFLERLDDKIRCTHEETVAVVKPWEDIGSNKSLGCVFSEKPADWTNAFKLMIVHRDLETDVYKSGGLLFPIRSAWDTRLAYVEARHRLIWAQQASNICSVKTVTHLSVTFSVSVPSGTTRLTEQAHMETEGAETLETEDGWYTGKRWRRQLELELMLVDVERWSIITARGSSSLSSLLSTSCGSEDVVSPTRLSSPNKSEHGDGALYPWMMGRVLEYNFTYDDVVFLFFCF